jgi:HD-GYP domain-containing protein (c-di-GMP phosphodiesterase class II)
VSLYGAISPISHQSRCENFLEVACQIHSARLPIGARLSVFEHNNHKPNQLAGLIGKDLGRDHLNCLRWRTDPLTALSDEMLSFRGITFPLMETAIRFALRMAAHENLEKGKLGRLGPVIHRELALHNAYDETPKAWGRVLELRDFETKGHTDRVVDLSVRLATKIGISAPELVHIRRGAYLRDIGKLAISKEGGSHR